MKNIRPHGFLLFACLAMGLILLSKGVAFGKVADPTLFDHETLEQEKKQDCMSCHDMSKENDKAYKRHAQFRTWRDKTMPEQKLRCVDCHISKDSPGIKDGAVVKYTHQGLQAVIGDESAGMQSEHSCGGCHTPSDNSMHRTSRFCTICHQSSTEWVEGMRAIEKEDKQVSTPKEGVEGFFSWGEMASTGEEFEYSKEKVAEWNAKLSKLKKISEIKKNADGTISFDEGDAIYLKREGREDPIYKAVVKIYPSPKEGEPMSILFSLDDDFGKIMENPIVANDFDNVILKEIYDFGYLEKGAAKSEIGYAKFIIIEETPKRKYDAEKKKWVLTGEILKRYIMDPKASNFMYSGDVVLGLPDGDYLPLSDKEKKK